MYKIALIALLSLPLSAGFFPKTVYSSVKSINGNTIKLKSGFPVTGMSGVVIHKYGNNLSAITSRFTQTSPSGDATLLDAGVLHHDELPTIKTSVSVGDKVIGGYLYNNVLLFAPDADTYSKIVSKYNKKWIHPDLFAVYLSVEGDAQPSKENLAHFAKKFQVGLIYIVRRNSAILLDPVSGKIVAEKSMKNLPKVGQMPFYMRFDEIEGGWFSGKSTGTYYQVMDTF
ncbi:MAG: hypothetical protein DRQ78_07970 [Epsilonproteobacteria bacterium]|nr:MAG: hypothetical protein DRQ78_07970 [Campylobacterota bacterium]